jgi:hypothetical protein
MASHKEMKLARTKSGACILQRKAQSLKRLELASIHGYELEIQCVGRQCCAPLNQGLEPRRRGGLKTGSGRAVLFQTVQLPGPRRRL